jgi:hypothetical protein
LRAGAQVRRVWRQATRDQAFAPPLRSRLSEAVSAGELPSSTDVERLSRFYLGVYQGIAVQARDGATRAELKGIAETAMAAWPGFRLATPPG